MKQALLEFVVVPVFFVAFIVYAILTYPLWRHTVFTEQETWDVDKAF